MFINLTNHEILLPSRDVLTPAMPSVRRFENRKEGGSMDGVQIIRRTFGPVKNLPEPKAGVFYIVPTLVGLALWREREDLLTPGVPYQDGTLHTLFSVDERWAHNQNEGLEHRLRRAW